MRLQKADCWDGNPCVLSWCPFIPEQTSEEVCWTWDRQTDQIAWENLCFGGGHRETHLDESGEPVHCKNNQGDFHVHSYLRFMEVRTEQESNCEHPMRPSKEFVQCCTDRTNSTL